MFIKKAAALVNSELHQLDKAKAEAIIKACDEVIAGKFRDQYEDEPKLRCAVYVF